MKQFTKLKRVKKQRADWEEMKQKSELPKQWLPKQKREKRNSRQSQKRKQTKKQQNKRQKPKPWSKKWNDIYSMWLWKKRAYGNGGVKSVLSIAETKTLFILGVYFELIAGVLEKAC